MPFHHNIIMTMIYYFNKEKITRRGESTIQVRAVASNVPPLTKIGGDIVDETIETDVTIITMIPASPVVKKLAITFTNISINRELTTRVTISTNNILSQNLRYTRKFIFQIRRSATAKR